MDISDYLIDQERIDWANLVYGWRDLLPSSFTVWLVNRFGDVVAVYEDGSVHLFDVANGTVQRIASSCDEFAHLVDREDNAANWLMIKLVDDCVTDGLRLSKRQCYGFKTLPFLGGEYSVENVYVADIEEYYSFLADLFQQTKDLPDRSQAKLVVKKAPPRPSDWSGLLHGPFASKEFMEGIEDLPDRKR